MAEKCDKWENAAKTALTSSPYPSYSPDSSLDVDVEVWQKETAQSLSPRSMVTSTYSGSSFNNPEKFGRPSAAYSVEKCQNFAGQNTTGPTDPDLVVTVHPELPSIEPLNSGSHWSRMFELWHIYRTHVDPVTKLIHCPSFSEQILRAASSPSAVDSSLQVLIFSICYAAVDVLSPPVVETRFQRRKDILISLYKQEMERALGEAALCQKPSLYVLQALVLHSICLYRRFDEDPGADTSLFDKAVSEASLLHPANGNSCTAELSLLDTQLLRRCWWTLFVLDYHRAAKTGCSPNPSLHSRQVDLPLNLNDIDLSSKMQRLPTSRTSITEMSYFLVIVELTQLEVRLRHLKTNGREPVSTEDVGSIVNERVRALEINFLWHCETSRPFDWLLLLTAKTMLNPLEIQMLESGQPTLSVDESLACAASTDLSEKIFSLALDVIECWYILRTHPTLSPWSWYSGIFRCRYDENYIESELGRWTGSEQGSRAQSLLELVKQ